MLEKLYITYITKIFEIDALDMHKKRNVFTNTQNALKSLKLTFNSIIGSYCRKSKIDKLMRKKYQTNKALKINNLKNVMIKNN